MPSEDDAARYFKIFFSDVHPYVPVVNRNHFYQQWQSDRTRISPLLLEAMLACAGRLSDDPAQGSRWLALANSKYSRSHCIAGLTSLRARGFVSRYASSEHYSSSSPPAQSSRGRTQKRLLLSFMDDVQDYCFNG